MDSCYFGDIHNELPIAKATVSQHLKELKNAGLIQGEIETPKVKYCINRENWKKAQAFFDVFFKNCKEFLLINGIRAIQHRVDYCCRPSQNRNG